MERRRYRNISKHVLSQDAAAADCVKRTIMPSADSVGAAHAPALLQTGDCHPHPDPNQSPGTVDVARWRRAISTHLHACIETTVGRQRTDGGHARAARGRPPPSLRVSV